MKIFSLSFLASCMLHSFAFASLAQSSDFNPLFENRPWEFIEDHFVIKVERSTNRFVNSFLVGIAAVSSAIAAGTSTYLIADSLVPETVGRHDIPAQALSIFFGTPLATLGGGVAGAKYVAYTIKRTIEYKALLHFVREWPANKSYTPSQFHPFFENLYRSYSFNQNETYLKEVAPEFISTLQRAVYEHFPYKYMHKLKPADEVTFYHAILTLDLTELIKLIGKAFTAFSESRR